MFCRNRVGVRVRVRVRITVTVTVRGRARVRVRFTSVAHMPMHTRLPQQPERNVQVMVAICFRKKEEARSKQEEWKTKNEQRRTKETKQETGKKENKRGNRKEKRKEKGRKNEKWRSRDRAMIRVRVRVRVPEGFSCSLVLLIGDCGLTVANVHPLQIRLLHNTYASHGTVDTAGAAGSTWIDTRTECGRRHLILHRAQLSTLTLTLIHPRGLLVSYL